MITGFEKIVEERIRAAQRNGSFNDLAGSGKPFDTENDLHIPEDLRLAFKMLKNADFIPPEIELKKKIAQTEELLENTEDVAEKYRTLKKLNFLIMKLNSMRDTSVVFEMPQKYLEQVTERMVTNRS